MRVLVLGGTRFIRPPVIRRLAALGHEVAVFHRGQTEMLLPPQVRSFHGNREQLGDFLATFRAYEPEVVLDTLAMTEQDARTVMATFAGLARRLVVLSSGDVYRAYDRLTGKDPGPPDPTPLTEDSPLRDKLFHYRNAASRPDDWAYHYDKILVERIVTSQPDALPSTVLRLPMCLVPATISTGSFRISSAWTIKGPLSFFLKAKRPCAPYAAMLRT
jgi:nucleoside-diphosphate-sugar epimerase